jgi:hypothetical protein
MTDFYLGPEHVITERMDRIRNPTRVQMIDALLTREDLLPSSEWPWTTARLSAPIKF